MWSTLKALGVPGRLTTEYFAGGGGQYVPPLRLFLMASVVLFLVAKLLLPAPDLRYTAYTASARIGVATLTYTCKPGIPLCDLLDAHARGRFADLPRAQLMRYVQDRLAVHVPYAMFLLLPVFALLTRVAYWSRPRTYGDHVVFALHAHSFVFLLAALAAAFQSLHLMILPAAVYAAWALLEVFGGRAWAATLRVLFVFLTYFMLLLATVFAMIAAAAFL